MLVLLWTTLFGCETDPLAPTCLEAERIRVFFDADEDGFGIPGTERTICPTEFGAPAGFSTNDDDCNDAAASINPQALEECDGRDNDCDGVADEGLRVVIFYLDSDGDGFGSRDLSLTTESCAPPVGYVENRQDCDDSDAGINPEATEVCDERDNDCNLLIDDDDPFRDEASAPRWYEDADQDGFGNDDQSLAIVQCDQPGPTYTLDASDCDDTRITINPDADEICNRIDDDCDNLIDDSDPDIDPDTQARYWPDDDLDGTGDSEATFRLACFQPWFFVPNNSDCDDDEPLLRDEATGIWWVDSDKDGFGTGERSMPSCDPPSDDHVLVAKGEDCNDDMAPFVNPNGREICDAPGMPLDNDCDGLVDTEDDSLDFSTTDPYWADTDNDTYGDPNAEERFCEPPAGFVANDLDCDDDDEDISPDATEVCDTIDNDCDGDIDDDDVGVGGVDLTGAPTFYADVDMDGAGDPNVTTRACVEPDGFVSTNDDCDDTNANRFPGNPEICGNAIDEDCDLVAQTCFQ